MSGSLVARCEAQAEHPPGSRSALRLLAAADVLMLAAAVLFAADLGASRAPFSSILLAVAWAITPGAAAFLVRSRGWPSGGAAQTAAALALAATTLVLGACGWYLLESSTWSREPLFVGTRLLILLVWSLGFLTFVPAVYRLQDFLGGGILLMAALERRADPWLFVPIWLLGLTISCAARHQLFDLRTAHWRPRVALRSGGVLGMLLSLVLGGLFALLLMELQPILEAPDDGDAARDAAAATAPDPQRRPAGDDRPAISARTIGFPERMSLAEIADARGDGRTVFQVRRTSGPHGAFDPARALWRVVALETFDARADAWLEADESFHRYAWPTSAPLRLAGVPSDDDGAVTHLDVEIVMPVFRNLVRPYGTDRVWRPTPVGSDMHYLANADAVIVPQAPRLAAGTRYRIRVADGVVASDSARGLELARDVPPEWRTLPRDAWLGFALRPLAAEVFAGATTLEGVVDALRAWFTGSFRYDLKLDWIDPDATSNLATFLLESRRGDCMYFATAAVLLLRAAGIPARFAGGFIGASPIGEDVWSVANARAHGWAEVPLADGGWLVIDPASWVGNPVAPAALEELEAEARSAFHLRLFPDLVLLGAALLSLLAFSRVGRRRDAAVEPAPRDLDRRAPAARLGSARELLEEYARFVRSISRSPARRRATQTPREHADAIARERPELAAIAHELVTLHERTAYGELEPSLDDLRGFRRACRALRKALARPPI